MNKENKIFWAALLAALFIFFIHLGICITIWVKYGFNWASVSAIISNMIQLLSIFIMSLSPCVQREGNIDGNIGRLLLVYYVIHVPVLVILILALRSCDLGENKYNCEALRGRGVLPLSIFSLAIMLFLSTGQTMLMLTLVPENRQDPSQADQTSTNNRTVCTRPSSNPQRRLPVTDPARLQPQATAQDSRSRVDQHQSRQNLQHSPAKQPAVYTLPSVDNNTRHAPEIDNLWNVSTNV